MKFFCKNKKYIINNVVEKAQQGTKQWPQFAAAIIANIFFLVSGLNYGWPSPSVRKLTVANDYVNCTVDEASWITSCQSIGNLAFAPIGALLTSYFGRRQMIAFIGIPEFISWILIAYAQTPIHLMIARFIGGVGESLTFISVPMYLGEISEPKVRGILGSIITGCVTGGMLLANIFGTMYDIPTIAKYYAVVPVLASLAIFCMPESPYYLILKKKEDAAKKALKTLRRTDAVDDEIARISNDIDIQIKDPPTYKKIFTVKANRTALLVMAGTRIMTQLSGMHAFSYYAQSIFNYSGIEMDPSTIANISLMAQIAASLSCSVLVDKTGRKPLFFVCSALTSILLAVLSGYFYLKYYTTYDVVPYQWYILAILTLYIYVCVIAFGTIPNLMLGEVFAANVKGKSLCILHVIYSACIFATAKIFLVILSGPTLTFIMAFYAAGTFVALFYFAIFVPETKGKTLEEIQERFRK